MELLKALLREITSGIEGKELAKLTGKSQSYVTQVLSGEQIPTDKTLAVIAQRYAPHRLRELHLAAALARISRQKTKDARKLKSGERPEWLTLTDQAEAALRAATFTDASAAAKPAKESGRTFADFPDAFYPMVLATGDGRRDDEWGIGPADVGALGPVLADMQWLMDLQLRDDVLLRVDRHFVPFDDEAVVRRFAEMNLLVLAGPKVNHLTRRVNETAVFRLNYSPQVVKGLEADVARARDMTGKELAAHQERTRPHLAGRMQPLVTGGIFDPTDTDDYLAAKYDLIAGRPELDFAVLTFAANPFYELKCRWENRPNDHRYVAILAAGIGHAGTAHALRWLGRKQRDEGVFCKHPYGGVLRVVSDPALDPPERLDGAVCQWEDTADGARKEPNDQRGDLLKALTDIERRLGRGELRNLELTAEQAGACRELIEKL